MLRVLAEMRLRSCEIMLLMSWVKNFLINSDCSSVGNEHSFSVNKPLVDQLWNQMNKPVARRRVVNSDNFFRRLLLFSLLEGLQLTRKSCCDVPTQNTLPNTKEPQTPDIKFGPTTPVSSLGIFGTKRPSSSLGLARAPAANTAWSSF